MLSILVKYKVALACLFFPIPLAVCSFFLSLHNPEGLWFQRSGSLIVLSGSFLLLSNSFEAVKKEFTRLLSEKGLSGEKVKKMWRQQDKFLSTIKFLEATYVLLGTIIWGYGDLLVRYYLSQ